MHHKSLNYHRLSSGKCSFLYLCLVLYKSYTGFNQALKILESLNLEKVVRER